MTITSLEGISDERLHEAFLSAFSDYEIKIDMTLQKFINITYAKDFNPGLSAGCFDDDRLVGFILIGYREQDEQRFIYDIATGVVEGYRKRGIGTRLLDYLIDRISDADISAFYLEVLENNNSARHLYENYGFKPVRYLRCLEKARGEFRRGRLEYGIGSDRLALLNIDETAYLSFRPSWQNTLATWRNSEDEYNLVTLQRDNILIAYGIIHMKEGGILQIGVHPDFRNNDIEKLLLTLLTEKTSADKIRFINIEDKSSLCDYLLRAGFTNFINQYEMSYRP